MTRTNPTLPEDVLNAAAAILYNFSCATPDRYAWRSEDEKEVVRDQVRAIAPLIIEWARRDQAEKDAQIAEGRHRVPVGADTDGNVYHQATARFPDDGHRVAAAIRAQFTPETTGGKTNG
jgi:hypothetical protein